MIYDLTDPFATAQALTGISTPTHGVEIGDRFVVWSEFDGTVIDGDLITYTSNVTGNSDVYVYRLSTAETFAVTVDPGYEYLNNVHGNLVTYTRRGNRDIYMYDISTGVETQITTDPFNQRASSIYGDRVVWSDERNGGRYNADNYMYDISTGVETPIATDPLHQQLYPSIYGDRVVWVDDRNYDEDIFVAKLTFAPHFLYVDADATGANDGTNWVNAYNYLQDALFVVTSGDEIWVAEGTYKPDESIGPMKQRFGGPRFELINGVAIYGGYAGFGEPNPNARDIELYETILSGDLDGDDGPGQWQNNDENSCHVVTGRRTDPNAILDGFTITAGNANGSGTNRDGGGMYNDYSSPTLTNCTFSGNSAGNGGGMYNSAGSPTVTNCTFSGNSADGYGGGMYNYNSSPTVTNCILWGDTATSGGNEIHNIGVSTPIISYCDIGGSGGSTSWDTNLGTDSGGNIDTNPLFVDADGADNTLGTEDDNLRLQAASPCIDAGDNTAVPPDTDDLDGDGDTTEPISFDLDGNPRFLDDPDTVNTGNPGTLGPPVVDMGAYERIWDSDGDGIEEPIDTEPAVDSNDFSDAATTSGTITDRGDQILFITDESDPCGVRIKASPAGGIIPASVSVCGGETLTFNQPPVAVCKDVTVSADGSCQGAVTVEDVDDDSYDPDGDAITLSLEPAGPYPLGQTTVTLTVTDDDGLSDQCQALVTVVDGTPPALDCPADVTVECGESTEPSDTGEATASDNCDATPMIAHSDSTAAGCGNTEVITRTWTATDAAGNSSSCVQVVTVVDTTGPMIELVGDAIVTVECHIGSYSELGAADSDDCDDGPIGVVIGGDAVDVDTPGAYVVTYDAVDDCGNAAAQVTRTVNVIDTTAPVVSVGDMAALWPANYKYREFKLSDLVVSVDDACGGLLDVDVVGTIVSIYSDEPEDAKGNGDGKTTDDIVILGASSFKVRSERAGRGNGRVYGVTFEVVDAASNMSVGTCYVGVAHDQSGDGPVDDGAGAGYTVP